MTATLEPTAADLEKDLAAPSSPLVGLRARRDAARKASFKDLKAPGYEPPLYVRFRAVTSQEITRVNKQHEKAKEEERGLRVNAALLAAACQGIFEVDEDGEPVGDPDGWPRFNQPEMATALGVDFPDGKFRAAMVAEAFYVDEIDVVAIGDLLAAWSLKTDEELSRDVPKG